MKVYIDPGHGGRDNGAVKYLNERNVNLVMAKACRDYLEANGVKTKMSRTSNETDTNLNETCREANAWGADYVISIHNNAGGGDGFEVYHSINGGEGKRLAKNIEKEVLKIGQNSRGLKTKKGQNGDYLGIIRMTKAPAVLCEGVFVDNKKDIKIADTIAEQKKFGVAYARGIMYTAGYAFSKNHDPDKKVLILRVGETYTLKTAMNVRTGPGTSYPVKKRIALTDDARKHALPRPTAVLKAGTKVDCLDIEKTGKKKWIKIPSGYICAVAGEREYVK